MDTFRAFLFGLCVMGFISCMLVSAFIVRHPPRRVSPIMRRKAFWEALTPWSAGAVLSAVSMAALVWLG